jgi:hypothetical protein
MAIAITAAVIAGGCDDDDSTAGPTPASPTPVAPTPDPGVSPTPEATPAPEPGVGETIGFLGYVRDIQNTDLYVSGRNVAVNPGTQFILEDGTPWSLAAVQLGDHVRVRGVLRADGFIDAERLTKLP